MNSAMGMITTLAMIPFTSLSFLTMKKTPWIYLVWSFTWVHVHVHLLNLHY